MPGGHRDEIVCMRDINSVETCSNKQWTIKQKLAFDYFHFI